MRLYTCAALAGALVLCACAPTANNLNTPRNYAAPPAAVEPSGPALVPSAEFENGYRMYTRKDYRQATMAFGRALDDNPGDYSAAYYMGMSYLMRGRHEDAREAFRLALELGPDRLTASRCEVGMAYSYESVRQVRMAHHHYHAACKHNKANGYAQRGASRTEYRDLDPEQKPRYRHPKHR